MKKTVALSLLLLLCFGLLSVYYFSAGKTIESDAGLLKQPMTRENWRDFVVPVTIPDEETRQSAIAMEPRYETMKSLPWETENLKVWENGNGKLLIETLKGFDLGHYFQPTYGNFNIDEVKEDFSKYAGEKIFLGRNYLLEIEKVEAGSEKANTISGGEEFYILTFETLLGGDIALYLFSTRQTLISEFEPEEDGIIRDYDIAGWPLGIDEEGRVVLAQ